MTTRKVVISERDNIATLFEDDRAVEFIIHRGDMLLGDVYLASVENILPSIDAAFVNVGSDKMGFLHSSDVQGKGDLKERLEPKQRLVVQVMKEPTGHKGPRVTTNITLPGRFIVLLPDSKGISISRKIEDIDERARLKSIVSLVKPPGVGVIIRTEAEGIKEEDLKEDFEVLIERWQNIVALADTAEPPTLLYRDQDLLYRVIREMVNEDIKEITVDTAFGYQRAQQLLQNWNLDKKIKCNHYNGNQSIMMGMGVDKEIKQALQTKVPLPSGGYLYIQPTEALCVVDVNSGKFTSLQSQAETIKITNLEACKEIARQLRLRNIGGMIIVDFIDMESRADQLTVLQAFEKELSPDKAKPQVGQLSDLGLVEMTRHRQGQALSEIFSKKCSSCSGHGHMVEDFNWAPPGIDSDVRERFSSRSKLPLRQSRAQQFQQQQKLRKLQREQQRKAKAELLAKAADSKPKSPEELLPAGSILLLKSRTEPSKKVTQDRNFDEFYRERLAKVMGLQLTRVAKLAVTPPHANHVLAKINAKCNDIWSILTAMESAILDEIDWEPRQYGGGGGRGGDDNRNQGRGGRGRGRRYDEDDLEDDTDDDEEETNGYDEGDLDDSGVEPSDSDEDTDDESDDEDSSDDEDDEDNDGPARRGRNRGRGRSRGRGRGRGRYDESDDEDDESSDDSDADDDDDTDGGGRGGRSSRGGRNRGSKPSRGRGGRYDKSDDESDNSGSDDDEDSSDEEEYTVVDEEESAVEFVEDEESDDEDDASDASDDDDDEDEDDDDSPRRSSRIQRSRAAQLRYRPNDEDDEESDDSDDDDEDDDASDDSDSGDEDDTDTDDSDDSSDDDDGDDDGDDDPENPPSSGRGRGRQGARGRSRGRGRSSSSRPSSGRGGRSGGGSKKN